MTAACARSWKRRSRGGLLRINQRVVGALRGCLAEQGCALLDTLGTQERGLSPLIVQLGRLLHSAGRASTGWGDGLEPVTFLYTNDEPVGLRY